MQVINHQLTNYPGPGGVTTVIHVLTLGMTGQNSDHAAYVGATQLPPYDLDPSAYRTKLDATINWIAGRGTKLTYLEASKVFRDLTPDQYRR